MSYRVYRNGVLIASPSAPPFTDTGLTNGVQYSYQVSEVNTVGEGPKAGPVTATPLAAPGNSLTVNSVSAFKTALANNSLSEIVWVDGTYALRGAGFQASNSLYIGASFASRTTPVLIRPQTPGGVTFVSDGTSSFGAITFVGGAHHQTWDGFKFGNGTATETGVIVFGGPNAAGLTAGPHHITFKNIEFLNTLHGYAYDPNKSNVNDHTVYFSDSYGGTHDILFENITSTGAASGPIHSLFHFYTHNFGIAGVYGAYNVIMRNITANGLNTPYIYWDDLSHDIYLKDATFSNSKLLAIRYEEGVSGANNTMENVTTINSGTIVNTGLGFYSNQGANPPGLTKINCVFG